MSSVCKFCQAVFDWGRTEEGWVPLVPIEEHDGLERSYQDENGVLRARHSLVCKHTSRPAVKITRLAQNIPGTHILPSVASKTVEPEDTDAGDEARDPQGGFTG